MQVELRWLIRRDYPEVLDIENRCFEHSWSEEDFLAVMRQRNCIGMVAECDGMIVGFAIYELHKSRLRILNFAVHPEWQRCGVGTAMVDRLKDKLTQQGRKQLRLETREGNLASQLFWKSQGFEAVDVWRKHYEDTNEDAYVFSFTLDVPVAESAGRVH